MTDTTSDAWHYPDIGFDLVSSKVLGGRVLLLEYHPTGAPPYSA